MTQVKTRSRVNERNDFDFIKSYCWANLVDYPIDSNGTVILSQGTSMSHMKIFPYLLFMWAMIAMSLKFMFTALTGNIGKEVSFVGHGIEEASSELISKLKAGSRIRDDS